MKISASILDYSFPSLDPAVWTSDMKLFAYQKDFILRLIDKMIETYGFRQSDLWVNDIVIIGSLTTSKWLFTSDLDVHIRVDLEVFRVSNMPQVTPDEAFNTLDETRKKFDRAKILAPMTQHPIEFYFESMGTNPSNVEDVGVYSIVKDAWLKEPVMLPADLDFEQSKKDVVAQAEALAQTLDVSFGKIQRDIQRIDELEDVVKAWGRDKQQMFYAKVEQKLAEIEAEIMKDLKIKQDLVDARHAGQDATSDVEIKFKWLARFGFFSILSNLKTLLEQTGGQITTHELPLIDKIISEARLRDKYLIDPSGKVIPMGGMDHGLWIMRNRDLLEKQYGIKHNNDDWFKVMGKLIEKGWVRITLSGEAKGGQFGIDLQDFRNIPSSVDNFIAEYFNPKEGPIYFANAADQWVAITDPFPSAQKAVSKALQRQRMGSIREAFLKEAFEKETETDICVDLDKTIAKPAKFPEIGEPIGGAKEALTKLQDMGYSIIIYSCRADTEDGLDLIREYLDKHDIPYDSIFEGEKPFAKFYIDDHAIRFDNWDNVIKQVEKSEKKASLRVTAKLDKKYWIDPSGKEYPVEHRLGHQGWVGVNILKKPVENLDREYGALEAKANEMITEGWTRVTTESDYDFAMEVADLDNLPSYLDNFIAHHYTGGGVEIDDLTGEYHDISDPFPNLRKAIYQAKRLRNAASLKVAKTKKVKQGDYSCLLALVPHDLAQEIVEWGVRNIPDEDIYIEKDDE